MFKKILKKIKKEKKGISLVIAVTTMTLLLSVSLSVSNIVLRQIKINTLTNNSKPAFFIADSAMECAMYYDTAFISSAASSTVNINSDFSTSIFGTKTISSGGEDDGGIFLQENIHCGIGDILSGSKDKSNPDKVISTFDINYGDHCAKVRVERTEAQTSITARGYNTIASQTDGCDLSNLDSRRVVERGLTITY